MFNEHAKPGRYHGIEYWQPLTLSALVATRKSQRLGDKRQASSSYLESGIWNLESEPILLLIVMSVKVCQTARLRETAREWMLRAIHLCPLALIGSTLPLLTRVQVKCRVGSGQWAAGSEHWALGMGTGQWALGAGRWAVGMEFSRKKRRTRDMSGWQRHDSLYRHEALVPVLVPLYRCTVVPLVPLYRWPFSGLGRSWTFTLEMSRVEDLISDRLVITSWYLRYAGYRAPRPPTIS